MQSLHMFPDNYFKYTKVTQNVACMALQIRHLSFRVDIAHHIFN